MTSTTTASSGFIVLLVLGVVGCNQDEASPARASVGVDPGEPAPTAYFWYDSVVQDSLTEAAAVSRDAALIRVEEFQLTGERQIHESYSGDHLVRQTYERMSLGDAVHLTGPPVPDLADVWIQIPWETERVGPDGSLRTVDPSQVGVIPSAMLATLTFPGAFVVAVRPTETGSFVADAFPYDGRNVSLVRDTEIIDTRALEDVVDLVRASAGAP